MCSLGLHDDNAPAGLPYPNSAKKGRQTREQRNSYQFITAYIRNIEYFCTVAQHQFTDKFIKKREQKNQLSASYLFQFSELRSLRPDAVVLLFEQITQQKKSFSISRKVFDLHSRKISSFLSFVIMKYHL